MDIDITVFIALAGVISSLILLFFKGPEDWYIPLAGSILVLLVPHVTCLVFSWHIPFAQCPVYTYGVYDLEEQLRKAAEATESVANTALSLAAELAKAVGALAAAMTAFATILAIASGGLTALLGGALDLLRIMNYANPAWQIAMSAYNVAMGIGMSYHVLAVLAKAAEHFVPLLLAAGMALMPLPRVRGFGAMIFALGLLLYVAAMAGLHFSGPTMEILKWLNSTNKWIGDMPKPSFNFSGYGFLAVQGGGMFFASYETRIDNATVQRALEELRALGINYTGLAITPGRDYVAGAVLTPVYGGSNVTWRGLNSSSPYVVFAWLDIPINRSLGTDRIQRRPWGFNYSFILPLLPDNVTVSTPSGNISLREWGRRVAEAERRIFGNLTPLWIVDAGPQQFWRLLFVRVNTTISLRNLTLYNGTERGVVGVWGWLIPPDEEKCEAAGAAAECAYAEITRRPGSLKYDVETNATTWVRPIAERLTSKFNMTLAEAPRPVRDGEERFYTWQEVCYYTCCSTCCDQSGCRTCCGTCSYYRTVWEEPIVSKILKDGEYRRPGILFDKPWIPQAPFNFTFTVGYVYRDWDVRKELRASAPDTGDCHEIPDTRRLYKKVVFWDVQPSFFMIYSFVWASSVEAAVDDMRRPLPDRYDGGPSSEDGAEVINLLRGAEHDQYCKVAYYGAAQPNWQLVPLAVGNMTSINRMYDAYLLTQGNYTAEWGRGAIAISNGSQFVAEGVSKLLEAYKPKPFIPMPEAAPTNYTMTQITVECVKFDWRSKSLATGLLTITPGAQVWLHNYTWLSSGLAREFVNKSAELWLWILSHPPPKPPSNLTRAGLVPSWLNATWLSTPHAFFGVSATVAAGMLVWYAASLMAAWMSIYPQILLAFLSVFAIFEALSWLLGFPSPGIHLMRFVLNTLEDLAFWYQVRMLIRGRVFARALRFLKSPMRAFAVLAVRKLYYKGYLRVKASERWKIETMLGLRYDEKVRRDIERKVEEKLTGKKKIEALAEKAKEYGQKAAAAAATAAVKTGMAVYKAAEVGYKTAKTIHEYTEGDAVRLLRNLSPAVDHKLESFLDYMAKRHAFIYHLFFAHLDEKPRWISALDLPRLKMLAEAGRIRWETYQKARNLVEYYYALRAYEKYKAVTEKLSEERVYEMAVKMAQEAVERSEKAMRALFYDLARGVTEEEILRRVKAVVDPLSEYHRGVFAKFSQIVARALEVGAPKTPEELAKLLVERRVEVLQRAPIIAEEWRQYWSAREVPYPARERMDAILAEFARVEIASELAELKTAALARRAAYLALEYESVRKALEAKLGTPEEQALRGRMQELERQMRGVVEEARRMMAEGRAQLPAWDVVERSGQYVLDVRYLDYEIRNREWLERVFEIIKIEKIERGGAVEETLSINEKAARKVLEATWQFFHDFGEKYVWLRHGPEERIYAVPKPGVEEVEQALDKALRVYGLHGREAAVEEFKRAVEGAKHFYASRGGREAVENIEALERRLLKLLEELPERPPSATPREEIAERLAVVEKARQALSDPDTAVKAIRLAREADEITIANALRLSEEAEAVKAFYHRLKSADYASLARDAEKAFGELDRQVQAVLKAIDEYVKYRASAQQAEDRWLKALYAADAERALRTVKAELQLAKQQHKRAEEALLRVKEVEETKPPKFAGIDLGQDVKVQRSEYFLPTDAGLYALAIAFTRRLEAVRRAATPEERRRAVAELAAVAELMREHPREKVAKALEESKRAVYFKAGSVEFNTERAEKLLAALGYAALAVLGRPESYAVSVMLEELAKELNIPKEALLRAASISPALAEAVKAVRELAARDPKFAKMLEEAKTEKDLEKIRAYLRAEAKALRAAERLDEYLRSPTIEVDLGYLIFAAERLQLKDVKKLLEVIGRMRGELSFFVERYFNVLYEELLPLLGWRTERMLLKAPPAVYVLNRMGPDLAKEVFSRYRGFERFGSELADVVPRVDLPLSVGIPTSLRPKFTQYPQRATRYVADWSDAGLASGLRRYYQTEEGRRHRMLAEGLAVGATAVALRKAAEKLLEEAQRRDSDALRLVAYLAVVRATREELKLAQLFEKVGAKAHADAIKRRASELYAEAVEKAVEILRRHYDEKAGVSQLLVDSLALYLGSLAGLLKKIRTKEDIKEAAERLAGRMHLMRVAAVAEAAGLEELRAPLAKAAEAVRTYLKLEHWLTSRKPSVTLGELRAEAVQALDRPLPAVERRVVEEAVARSVRLWLAEEAGRLARLAQWLEEPYLRAKDKRHREDIRRIREVVEEAWKNAVEKLAEEAKAVAEFSPSALQELRLIAESWAGAGHYRYPAHRLEEVAPAEPREGAERLYKYIGMRILQEIRDVQPAKRLVAELYERLPARLRQLAEARLRDVERALIREGYYDELLRSVYKSLYLPVEREDPRGAFGKIAERAAEAARTYGVDPTPLAQAADELRRAPLKDLPKAAAKAGDALAEVVSKVVEVVARRRAEELRERGVDVAHDAGFLLSTARRVIRRISRRIDAEALAVDAVYRLVSRTAEEVNRYLDRLEKAYFEFAVLKTRRREVAEAYARRFIIRPAAADEYDLLEGVFKRREVYLIIHPSLQAAVDKALDWLAGELAKKEEVPVSHMFVGPPELGFVLAERTRLAFAREGRYYKFFQVYDLEAEVKAIAELLVEREVRRAEDPTYSGPALKFEHLRRYAPIIARMYGAEYDPLRDAGYVHKADFAIGYAVGKELLKVLAERVRRGEAKPWMWGIHKDLAEGVAKALGEAAGAVMRGDHLYGLMGVLKYLGGEEFLPPDVGEALYEAAVRLYSLITGTPEEDLWSKTLWLREVQVEYVKKYVELAEEKLGLRRGEEEREKRPEKKPPERKPAEKPQEKPEKPPGAEAERPQEEEKKKPEEKKLGAKEERPPAKGAGEKAEAEKAQVAAGLKAAGEAPRGAEAPRGEIPEGLEGVKAVVWLVNAYGAELEDASPLVKAASKVVEKYATKLERMEPALRELAKEALDEAVLLIREAARSKSALEKLRMAFEIGENAVFGYAPESAEEVDAAKLLAKIAKHVQKAEEELGAGLKVWGLVQQFALALIDRVEAEYDRVLKAATTIERALIPAAVSVMGVVGAIAAHDAVLSAATPIAAAIALAKADQLKEAVKKAKEAAERIYETARELWEAAKITLERIYEAVVEAIARALDYVKAHWFIFAAAAAGLIAYSLAQQLDFQLWMEHVAKLAPAIAGVPAFKKAELPLREKAPEVWEAVERFWERGEEELKALVGKLGNSGWLKAKAVEAMDALKRSHRRITFTWRDVALAYALLEAAYRYVSPPDIETTVKEIAEELKKGKAVDVTEHYKQLRAFAERVRETEWRLRARLEEIRERARGLGLTEGEFELELAEELARATKNESTKLGEATLADKVLASILGLATDSAYSRAVLWLAERGEGPRALALAPKSTYERYKESRKGARGKAEEEPFRAVIVRLLAGLAAFDLEDVRIVPKTTLEELLRAERGELEIVAVVRTEEGVKEVSGIVWWERKSEGGVTLSIKGGLLDFLKNEKFVERVKKDSTITDDFVWGWLVTDASVGEGVVRAETTSLLQAALYKASGLEEVKAEDKGTVTEAGFKVYYYASSSKLYQLYREIADGVRALLGLVEPLDDETKKAVKKSLKKLKEARGAVEALVDRLLADDKISVYPAAGLSAEEVAERVKKAASEILSRKAARRIDPVENAPYGRIYYPLVDMLLRNVSEVEFAQFFTTAVFGDGTVTPHNVELTLGEFRPKGETLPYNRFHKLALWLAVVEKYRPVFEKYGVDITPSVYIGKNYIRLRLEPKAAGLLFALGGGWVWRAYDEYLREVGRNLWDAGFIKAERMLETVKEAFKDVKVLWQIDEGGKRPVLRVQFVREVKGREVEIANLNVYMKEPTTGKTLHAEFKGVRERAEVLASLLRAWGAEAEAKPMSDKKWRVDLTTGQLSAVDHPDFKAALEAFVKRAVERGLLTEEQAEKKLAKVKVGPNTVEIAGVELSLQPTWEGTKLKTVEIIYNTSDRGQLEKAAKALEEFGLMEGVDFTAKWDDKGTGDLWLKAGTLERAVEALKAEGFKEGEDFTIKRAKGGSGMIRIKNPKENLEKALEVFKKAGLVEGEDYTVSSDRGVIRLTVPMGLWAIAWRAKKGDEKAEKALGQLLEVAKKLGIRQYFEERIRPVLMAGTKNAVGKKITLKEKGITVEITGFKVEWVSFKDKDNPCNWPKELCRPRVTIRYKIGDKEQEFTVTWGVGKKGEIQAYVNIENRLDKAAALTAVAVWEGDEEEKNRIIDKAERSGVVGLTLDNLLAMAQHDASLLEWAMHVKRAAWLE